MPESSDDGSLKPRHQQFVLRIPMKLIDVRFKRRTDMMLPISWTMLLMA
jgi:hypothetical protein